MKKIQKLAIKGYVKMSNLVSRIKKEEAGEIGVIWYVGIGLIAVTILVAILALLNPAVSNYIAKIFGKMDTL